MKRHRTIASAPQRSATEAWETIVTLVGATLERSASIEREAVDAACAKAAGVGRMLTAGGHLEQTPVTLVAGELFLEITTVSGAAALELDENLNPVPGGASAEDWKLHLPPCEPLAKLVRRAAKEDAHLSSDEPTKPATKSAARSSAAALDEVALAAWAREGE